MALAIVTGSAPVAAQPTTTRGAAASHIARVPHLGVMTDLGVPDGAAVSLALRPTRAVRVELGVAHNGVSPGVRAGISWIPFGSWATPTLGVAYGRFFERDANPLVRMLGGDPTFSSPVLERISYDFANARVGLELGRKRFTLFLHAGISLVTGAIHNLDAALKPDPSSKGGSMVTVSTTDPRVRVIGVSASLGFVLYLF